MDARFWRDLQEGSTIDERYWRRREERGDFVRDDEGERLRAQHEGMSRFSHAMGENFVWDQDVVERKLQESPSRFCEELLRNSPFTLPPDSQRGLLMAIASRNGLERAIAAEHIIVALNNPLENFSACSWNYVREHGPNTLIIFWEGAVKRRLVSAERGQARIKQLLAMQNSSR